MERKSKGSMFKMKKSPLAKLFGDFEKTKIKDVDKSKEKIKIGRRRGDTNISLFNFGKR